jgi:P-type E1-E2 ATPase
MKVICRRSGKEDPIQYDNIVVGDIIKIKAGMNIPVDGILIEGSGVTVSEAAMTGESDELKKENIEMCKQRRDEKD